MTQSNQALPAPVPCALRMESAGTGATVAAVTPCFTPGTTIATPKGNRPVETLCEGDQVITRDNGMQTIKWAGRRTILRAELLNSPQLRPILIKAGALGDDLPQRDMMVSPHHRMLVAGERTKLHFREAEVLVEAKHLVNHNSIRWVDTLRTTYIHFMCERHEIVMGDGVWTESFQPDDLSLGGLCDGQRNEILRVFPELETAKGLESYQTARRALTGSEAVMLQK